jgi:hypothetical protein
MNKDGEGELVVGAAQYNDNAGRLYLFYSENEEPVVVDGLESAHLGWPLASGDVNGDGYPDVIAGAIGSSIQQGRAYIVYGSNITPASGYLSDSYLGVIEGESVSLFGYGLGVGDNNQDGKDDILVGAPEDELAGKAYWFKGTNQKLDQLDSSAADQVFAGLGDTVDFGRALSGGGDFNGDGTLDILVGSGSRTVEAEKAYLFDGSKLDTLVFADQSAMRIMPEGVGEDFGRVVAWVGDLNGDGFDEFAVAESAAGQVFLYYGQASGLSEPVLLQGESPNHEFGAAVAGVGDINSDGFADLVIGAPGYHSNAGGLYIYLGKEAGIETTPSSVILGEDSSRLGSAVIAGGDIDGNGLDDFIAAASQARRGSGRVYVFSGSIEQLPSGDVLACAAMVIKGVNDLLLGNSLASAGDINKDGLDDILIGTGAAIVGSAYLVQGELVLPEAINLNQADATLTAELNNDGFGQTVCGPGDLNGDGYADIVVGAPDRQNGRLYIYHGKRTGIVSALSSDADTTLGENFFTSFAEVMAAAGDINKDSYADLLVQIGEKVYLYPGDCERVGRYQDTDQDGYGGAFAMVCSGETGYVDNNEDCDDQDATISPAGQELCDLAGKDEDYDGVANDADANVPNKTAWYADNDVDGYGAGYPFFLCYAPAGYVATSGDCNDYSAASHPTAIEDCRDGIDTDCDGISDLQETDCVILTKTELKWCSCANTKPLPGVLLGLVALFAARRKENRYQRP